MKQLLFIALSGIALPAAAQTMDQSMPGMDMSKDQPPSPEKPKPTDTAEPNDSATSDPVGTDQAPGSASPPPIVHNRLADRYFDPSSMTDAEAALMGEHSSPSYSKITFNLAEYQSRNGKDGYRWDAEAWWGDLNRVVIKSQGEGTFGEVIDQVEVQALYSRALDPWWNLQLGVRHDFQPIARRTYATVGIEGLAPYWFDVSAAAFLSDQGKVSARIEGSYDQRITQRLILQPRLELNLSAQDIPGERIGSGLSDAELGLRLRYEVQREFAPYIGVSWTWKTGDTARYARLDGKDPSERSIVVGIRTWF